MKTLVAVLLVAGLAAAVRANVIQVGEPHPGVDQIVRNNAAARGGVDAWRRVQTLVWSGHVESSNAQRPQLPFVLDQKRPDRTRFEIGLVPHKAVRIFDGSEGWKLHAGANGLPELSAFGPDEMAGARDAQVIEGPLMDCVARQASITLAGKETLRGRAAWVLEARLASGTVHRLWIDAQTWLELRDDRQARDAAGRGGVVSVYFLDYRDSDGLQMPFTIETVAANGQDVNRLVIARVEVNVPLADAMFVKPALPGSRKRGVMVDTRSAAQSPPPAPQP